MNRALEKTDRNAMIFSKGVHLLMYHDDIYIDMIDRTKRVFTGGFRAIELEFVDIGLTANEIKTKYMAPSSNIRHNRIQFTASRCES